ncbi:MAG: HEAT repeat domain-containing protein [Candidatus Sumerlaeota bacterium]|nr:HEAT repeat domain-containing protein [Candidatus Sumerlaeota bacterium]
MAKLSAKELRRLIVEGQIDQATAMIGERLQEASPSERSGIIERLGEVAQDAYDDFAFKPTDLLIRYLAKNLGTDVARVFDGKILHCKERTKAWHAKLLPLDAERHIRHLRECVRARDVTSGLEAMQGLLGGHQEDENYDKRLQYIGASLGSLANDQDTVAKLLLAAAHQASRFGWNPVDVSKIEGTCEARFSRLGAEPSINREREFRAALTQAIVDMRAFLPPVNILTEVTPAQMREVSGNLRAIMRTAFLPKHPVSWTDLCNLFVEFVPSKVSAAGAMGGVEGRLCAHLGPGAMTAVRMVFKLSGEIEAVRHAFLQYAAAIKDPKELARAAEVMSLMAHPEFNTFIQQRLSERQFQSVRMTLTASLGRSGTAESSKMLVDDIRSHIRGAERQGEERRRVIAALRSLGDLLCSGAEDLDQMRQTLDAALALARDRDDRLALEFALRLLPPKPAETLSAQQRRWFLGTLMRALWLGDETPEFAGGNDMQRTMLGWREEIADAVIQFGETGLEMAVDAAEPLAARYSSAYLALAEIAMQTRGPALLSVLETALRVAAMQDESAQSKYARETYYDSTERKRKPVTQKMILAALTHSIHRIGGPLADAMLLEYHHQIQAGLAPSPDADAAKVLYDVVKRAGEAGPVEPGQGGASAKAAAGASSNAADGAPGGGLLKEKKIQESIAELSKWRLFTGAMARRAAKVAAIQTLTVARPSEAIDPLIETLESKDSFVVSAALNALREYATPTAPASLRDALLMRCGELLETAKPELRQRIESLLGHLNPLRDPVNKFLKRELSLAPPGTPLHQSLSRVLTVSPEEALSEEIGKALAPAKAAVEAQRRREQEAPPPASAAEPSSAAASRMDLLTKKREYLKQRQEWIRRGKSGKEPDRPPGI